MIASAAVAGEILRRLPEAHSRHSSA